MKKPDVEKISLRMEMKWTEAESRIIQDIARRIHKSGKITSTADYQINRLVELGRSTEEIEKILQEALGTTREEMYKLYDDVSNWQYVRNKDLYEQINREFIPPEENEWLKQISSAAKEQTADALTNLSQSYGFAVMMGTRKVFMPFAQYYQKYVDEAIMDIISGGFDYNTVIRRVVTQMTNSGLRTVDYASGHSNRTPVAVRRAVLTGVAQITGKIAEKNATKLGTDYYEVDWHAGARPEHRIWQGRVYSYKELETVCGLGTVTGLHGANCYHDYYPFVPGVSERLYSDDWLEEQNQKEEQTKNWNGKDYNLYEQTQKMRQMETSMRAQREKVDALKAAKADADEITLARAKYQAQLNEYSQFCKKMGLKEQRERIYYDMRGRIAPGRSYVKLSDTTDKWAKAALKELMKDEKDISKRVSEKMIVYDKDGRQVMVKVGGMSNVRLSVSEIIKLKDCVITHNHPSGGSFSKDDWQFLRRWPVSEIRAVTENSAFYIRKPKKWPEEINSKEKLNAEIDSIREELKEKYQKMYRSGIINKTQRHQMFSEEVSRTLAERYGIEFGKENLDERN